MAYQAVGTPRFYVNDVYFHMINGIMPSAISGSYAYIDPNVFELNPTNTYEMTAESELTGVGNDAGAVILPMNYDYNYVFFLNHNLATSKITPYIHSVANDPSASINIVDADTAIQYDGFSLLIAGAATSNNLLWKGLYNQAQPEPVAQWTPAQIGSISAGRYFDMPHSPDLNLTMTREYGGIKTIETKGGASLSNAFYTKPPDWQAAGAWELYLPNTSATHSKALSRSGRRVWDLSFSYLDDGDVFGANQSLFTDLHSGTIPVTGGYYIAPDGTTYDPGDLSPDALEGGYANTFTYDLLTDDNFFSVIHKTNGGRLPFIFNPAGGGSKPNNNIDMFAICKFDMKSFQFKQVANGVYNIKLKIREVW